MVQLEDFEKQVKTLILAKNWAEAYKICEKILSYAPENHEFLKLKLKIEKAVKEINQSSIKKELGKLEPLLHEQRFEEYLRQIAPLQSYVKDYPPIGQKILAAKKLMDDQYQKRKDAVFQEILNESKKNLTALDFQTSLQKLEQLRKTTYSLQKISSLEKKLRNNWIKQEIKLNRGLINSQKFEDIMIFLFSLKKINSANHEVTKLSNIIKKRYQLQKIENQKDFIFKTLEEIKNLYIRKRFDQCIELAEKILEIDSNNKQALKAFSQAKRQANHLSQKNLCKQIHENNQKFRSSKAFLEKNYIRI